MEQATKRGDGTGLRGGDFMVDALWESLGGGADPARVWHARALRLGGSVGLAGGGSSLASAYHDDLRCFSLDNCRPLSTTFVEI